MIKYKVFIDLYYFIFEVLWVFLRFKWLLRGFFCIVCGIVYYIKYLLGVSDEVMLDYFKLILMIIEGFYLGCGILLIGDFNCFNISCFLL